MTKRAINLVVDGPPVIGLAPATDHHPGESLTIIKASTSLANLIFTSLTTAEQPLSYAPIDRWRRVVKILPSFL